jgi:heme A synthase
LAPAAHFTLSELPGTAAIWGSGIALGLALGTRRLPIVLGPLLLMAALAGLGMLADAYAWPEPLKLAVDAAFLLAALAVAAVLWRGLDPPTAEGWIGRSAD